MWKLLASVACVGTAAAAPVPKEFKKPDDKTRLTGAWVVARVNVAGNEMAAANTALQSVVFDDQDGMRTKYKGIPDSEWTITLDPTASPKRMHWRGKDGKAGNEYPCVYDFTPNGNLRIAIILRNKPAPASVEPGPDLTFREFKRSESK